MGEKCPNTVLVVDDDHLVLSYVEDILISLSGYRLIIASGGNEALQLAEKHTNGIDLLLTDYKMPGMNGLDLAKRFKTMFPKAKVLFMSGHVGPANLQKFVQTNSNGFMQKPFSPNALLSRLSLLLC